MPSVLYTIPRGVYLIPRQVEPTGYRLSLKGAIMGYYVFIDSFFSKCYHGAPPAFATESEARAYADAWNTEFETVRDDYDDVLWAMVGYRWDVIG